jgi:hypothetical protein
MSKTFILKLKPYPTHRVHQRTNPVWPWVKTGPYVPLMPSPRAYPRPCNESNQLSPHMKLYNYFSSSDLIQIHILAFMLLILSLRQKIMFLFSFTMKTTFCLSF